VRPFFVTAEFLLYFLVEYAYQGAVSFLVFKHCGDLPHAVKIIGDRDLILIETLFASVRHPQPERKMCLCDMDIDLPHHCAP
jgi:hypothetical protein